MLDYAELVRLEKDLRTEKVLSVYVNGGRENAEVRRHWRLDLRHEFDDIAMQLEASSHVEREAFARSRRIVEEWLERFPATVGSAGWAGFFTVDGEYLAGQMPVSVPTMAVWQSGACVTPYLRVLKEACPVVVAVVDARRARIHTYVGGRITSLVRLRAHIPIERASHMGRPSRQGFHSGTRGRTGTDAAQRELLEGTTRMLAELRNEIVTRAADGWIVVGGIREVAANVLAILPPELVSRTAIAKGLDVHASHAEIAECARRGASELRTAYDVDRVNRVIAEAEAFGRGEFGLDGTRRALQEGSAQHVYLTSRFLDEHLGDAELLVRLAFDSRAIVEHVSGEAAERLQKAGGVAAQLRYVRTAASVAGDTAPAVAVPA